jgi:hypothetical protein
MTNGPLMGCELVTKVSFQESVTSWIANLRSLLNIDFTGVLVHPAVLFVMPSISSRHIFERTRSRATLSGSGVVSRFVKTRTLLCPVLRFRTHTVAFRREEPIDLRKARSAATRAAEFASWPPAVALHAPRQGSLQIGWQCAGVPGLYPARPQRHDAGNGCAGCGGTVPASCALMASESRSPSRRETQLFERHSRHASSSIVRPCSRSRPSSHASSIATRFDRYALRGLEVAVVKQRLDLGQRPRRRHGRVGMQPTQGFDAQVAIDQHEPLGAANHDRRHLLPDLGD